MTARETSIAAAILDAMHNYDGGQAHELTIHADATLIFRVEIPRNEFAAVFADLNRRGAFLGVATEFKGTLWSLTPRGEKIRQEMK